MGMEAFLRIVSIPAPAIRHRSGMGRCDRMRAVVWPRISSMMAIGLFVALAALLRSFSYLFSPVIRWSTLTVAAREGVVLPLLVLAVAMALLGRVYGADSLVVGRLCAKGSFRVLVRQTGICCLSGIIGYAAGLLPLTVRIAMGADYGGPDILALLSTLTTLSSLTIVASVMGAVIASRWMVIILPLGMLAVLVIGPLLTDTILVNTGRSALLPAPVWNNDFPSLGWTIEPMVAVYRAVFFVVIAMASLKVGRYVLDGVNARRWTRDPVLVSCSIIAVIMAFAPLALPMALVRGDGQSMVCSQTSRQVVVCVHPADRNLLGDIANAGYSVLDLAPQTRVTLREHVGGTPWDSDAGTAIFATPANGMSRAALTKEIQRAVAETVTGSAQCAVVHSSLEGSRELTEGERVLDIVRQEILIRLGSADPIGANVETGDRVYRSSSDFASALGEYTDAQFADWFTEHREILQSCTASKAQVMPAG